MPLSPFDIGMFLVTHIVDVIVPPPHLVDVIVSGGVTSVLIPR